MAHEVHTKHGKIIVDDDNAHLLEQGIAVVRGTYSTHVRVYWGGKMRRLSRIIGRPEKGMVVDHINGDPMDNRRDNLRICTVQQNNWNRKRRPNGSSSFKGVCAVGGRFTANIAPNGKMTHLGSFATEEEAARAYDKAAREHYGEFACLNFPSDNSRSAVHLLHAEGIKP
jgi:hypothetical protein